MVRCLSRQNHFLPLHLLVPSYSPHSTSETENPSQLLQLLLKVRTMKGTSKVIMGATLVMVVSLAIVLGLVLVLLAELYCSLLLRRRQLRNTTSNTTTTPNNTTNTSNTHSSQPPQPQDQSTTHGPPLSSFYAQGVLHAPRSFLFPLVSSKETKVDIEKQHSQLRRFLESQIQESATSPHRIGLVSPSPSSSSFVASTSLQPIQKTPLQETGPGDCSDGVCSSGENFMYISNPIYDNDGRPGRVDTPFETPDTSPSRLERGGSSGDDEIAQQSPSGPSSLPMTPPLTPMKKLPKEACSISLRDATSLGTSGSDSVSNNGLSSSSGSPCTSPSW